MAESPERDRLRLMTLRSIFGWIKPCNLIAIGTVEGGAKSGHLAATDQGPQTLILG
jgi:hypothetical protein